MRYEAHAELRRLHSEAEQHLAGVVIDDLWYPAHPGISPASDRLAEAGLVELVELPAFIAPDLRVAVAVALDVAAMAGYAPAGEDHSPRWERFSAQERLN